MFIYKIAQNVPYLLNIGVPPDSAQDILDYLTTIDKKDRGKVLKQVKDNPEIPLEELKKFKIFTQEDKQKQLEEKQKNIPEDVREWANKINPSYIDWLYKMVLNESVATNGEDDENIKEVLKNFDIFKRRKDFPKENKDINFYKTFSELAEVISNLKQDEPKTEILANDPDIIYDEDGLRIVKIDATNTERINKINNIAKNTDCCINNYSSTENYAKRGTSFYFGFINGELVALIHPGSNQIKNKSNAPVSNYLHITQLHDAFIKLGIEKTFPKEGDFIYYFKMLDIGKEINTRVSNANDKIHELQKLQNEFIEKTRREYYSDKDLFGEKPANQQVSYFLSDEQFENPDIQAYVKEKFLSKLRELDHLDPEYISTTNFTDYRKIYDQMPLQMKLIPEIRQQNKDFFVREISNSEWDKDLYRNIGRELKSFQEIQAAYKKSIENKLKNDPLFFLDKDFPERFKKSMQGEYVGYLTDFMENNPSMVSSFSTYNSKISNRFYDTVPEDIKKLPQVQKAYEKSLLKYIEEHPDYLIYLPENLKNRKDFIQAARQGLLESIKNNSNVYQTLPDELKQDPEFKAVYRSSLLDDIRNNPATNLEGFENDPEMIQANKDGWIAKIERTHAGNTLNFINHFQIPTYVLNSPEFQKQLNDKLIPHAMQRIKLSPNTYDEFPDLIKNNPMVIKSCENSVIDIIKKAPKLIDSIVPSIINLPRVQVAINQILIPAWIKQVSKNYALYEKLPSFIKDKPEFKEAHKKGLIYAIQNPKDIPTFEYLLNTADKEILESPEVQEILNSKQNQIPLMAWINTAKNNPFSLKNIPQNIQKDPTFQENFKNNFIKFIREGHANIRSIDLFMMQNKNYPPLKSKEVIDAVNFVKNRHTIPTKKNPQPIAEPIANAFQFQWYKIAKENVINPIEYEINQIKQDLELLDQNENL